MEDNKNENTKGCSGCGDERILLTEELNAVPRCAGCGKSRAPATNTSKPQGQ